MKKSIVIAGICICFCMAIYIYVYSYTNKINEKNIYNTFEISEESFSYFENFLNEYKETVINSKDDIGYSMLDNDTKKIFNNDINEYSKSMQYIRDVINKFIKEKTKTTLNFKEKNYIKINNINTEVINCEIVSTIWDYLERTELDYYKYYSWFKDLKLIEYLPKKYKISFADIEKEDVKWKVDIK